MEGIHAEAAQITEREGIVEFLILNQNLFLIFLKCGENQTFRSRFINIAITRYWLQRTINT